MRPACPSCGTALDDDGYCVDPGCTLVGKTPAPVLLGRPMYLNPWGQGITWQEYVAGVQRKHRGEWPWRIASEDVWVWRGLWPFKVRVSTVWLGIDHSLVDVGPPMIFETMTFVRHKARRTRRPRWRYRAMDQLESRQWRYATIGQAARGHERVVAWLRKGARPTEPEGEV